MIGAVVGGSLSSACVLGVAYAATKHKLGREPFTAITSFFRLKEKTEALSARLSKKEVELKKKEKALRERSEYLDEKYQEIVDDSAVNKELYERYIKAIKDEDKNWMNIQRDPVPKVGQEPVLQLLKRYAGAKTGAKGYYKYLHDHRGTLADTQYQSYLDIQRLLLEEFSGSDYKDFALNLFRFLSGQGYNIYVISWILMISLHDLSLHDM